MSSHDDHRGHETARGADEHGELDVREEHVGDASAPEADTGHGAHGATHGGGHGGGHGDHAAMFRDRFWLSLALSVPVVAYSHMVQEWFGYTAPQVPGHAWIAPVLGTAIFLYGGWPFLAGAVQEARDRQPGMMLLIGMAVSVAFVASLATSMGLFDLDFWWELALLIDVMLLGHWMEMRAIGQARGALQALAELLPDDAERVTDDGTETVRTDQLQRGDVVLVRPGGRVPADGEVVEGTAEVDESMITGESNPVAKEQGDDVVAGTVVADSAIRVRVGAVGDDTTLAGIQRLVAEAQQSGSRAEALADRAAAWLFYVAAAAAVITFVTWLGIGQLDQATVRTVTVLVIACPHALGLAIPLVVSISTSISARNGVLVKDRLALERMREVDVVLFDKTGTLTAGAHAVTDLAVGDAVTEEELLRVAAAVEADSEHPLARAIVTRARDRGVQFPRAEAFESMTGRGVRGRVDGRTVAIGGPALLREYDAALPGGLREAAERWKQRGAAVMHVLRDGDVIGAFALEDQVRPESRAAVDALHERGVTVAMITGDAQQVADAVAADLGIDEVFAEVLPQDKDAQVSALQERGQKVAMVGDGVNDAPALARADVGIAIGAGTDVAIESAGIVLASDDPRAVLSVIELSHAAYRKMLQNLAWAAGYNVFAIPLAAGVLAGVGFVLPPAVGALLMSASTVVVALNAQLLRRVDLRRPSLADATTTAP